MVRTVLPSGVACLISALLSCPALGEGRLANVIYTNLSGHPTAQVPGVPGEQFRSPLVPFLSLYGSPNGTHWIFKGFTDNPSDAANEVICVGTGPAGAVVAKEGDPAPVVGLTYGFFDSDCGVSEGGLYAFGNRLNGGSTSADEVIFKFDGAAIVLAAREGDPAPGLVDPGGLSGDELFGNSLNSAHILMDGTASFRADLIQNINSDYESALYQGSAVLAQEGTTAQTGETYDSFSAFGILRSDATGANWIVEADVQPGSGTVEAAVVNDAVEIADGDVLPGFASPVDAIQGVAMGGSGDWLVRGDNLDDAQWVVVNGAVLAQTGDPITPGAGESYAVFFALAANGAGDVVVGATTDGAAETNEVIVLNGEVVVVQKGDPVDLDGNGQADDDFFITDFDPNDLVISDDLNDDLIDDRMVYFFAEIQDSAGKTVADTLLWIGLVQAPLGDLNNDGVVNAADLALLLGSWGPCAGCPADLNGDGDVNAADLALLLGNWG